MSFDYEASIWGRGTATTRITDPAAFRLRAALRSVQEIKAGEKVVEVGCGAGQFIRAIKNARPDLECFGTDISLSALNDARSADDGVTYLEQQEYRLPFDNSSVSAILVFDVLEHVADPSAFIIELKRVLRPGGIIYAFVPCEGDRLSFWNLLNSLGIGQGLTKKYAGHIQKYTRDGLLGLFIEKGMRVYVSTYSEHFFGQLAGLAAFFAMDRAAKNETGQINNESFFSKKTGPAIAMLKNIGNSLIFAESSLLHWLPSPNIHLVVQKP